MKALLVIILVGAFLAAACGDGFGQSSPPPGADTGSPASNGIAETNTNNQDRRPSITASDTKIVVTSSLNLAVDHLRPAYDQISQVAGSLGGYVATATISDAEKSGSARLKLRVPAPRYDELIAALRGLKGAKVTREELQSREVTADYVDLQSRLANLQRSETQYQEILGRAQTIPEVLQVSSRLDSVRGDIDQTQGRVHLLSDQVDLATVNVSLAVPAPSTRSGLPRPPAVFAKTLQASLVLAQLTANAFVALVAISVWALPLGLATLFLWRRAGKPLLALGSRIISS